MHTKKLDELPANIRKLCNESLVARKASYSPYSKFAVGASISSPGNSNFTGCNVENASYGLAICAERTAIVKAVSTGVREFDAIAIAAECEETFVGPCGACRQFMCEFNPELPIYLVRPYDMTVQVTSLKQLLPESFSPKTMNFAFHNGK